MTDQSFWVIETGRNTYWNGHGNRVLDFTTKIDDAIKFADYGSAEIVRCWALDPIHPLLRAVEHSYFPSPPSPSTEEKSR